MEKNIKRLLKDLANPDGDLRALSAMTLLKIEIIDAETRDEVLKELMKATKDKNISVRFFLRKAIAKLRADRDQEGTPPAAPPIDQALASEDFEERMGAVMRINREGKTEYKDRLIEMLKHEHHDFVKAALLSCLPKFVDKSQAELFSPFLGDADNRVRANAIDALEAIKAETTIPLLFPLLEDTDNRIRASAAKALSSFGEEKVFTVLKKMLQSQEEWMKMSAIHALSHITSGESIKLLLDAAKNPGQADTRLRAMGALANYHDLATYGFLKHMTTNSEEPFKGAAVRALKLMEEKFGAEAPVSTLVVDKEAEKKTVAAAAASKGDGSKDVGSSVVQFFRKGKDQAVGMSQNAAIKYALTDLQNEMKELQKEAGRVIFEIYQRGDLQLPDLLTVSHEVLRMNFFIQKYTEEAERNAQPQGSGLFASLKNLFGKAQAKDPKLVQAEKFTQKREELYQKLGQLAFTRFADKIYTPAELEGYFKAFQNLESKLQREKDRIS